MIFYFSGTGNSSYVANELGRILKEKVYLISTVNPATQIFEGERLIFVFPVYSWGVPPIVINFILNLSDVFKENLRNNGIPISVVMTCGDEVGKAPEMIEKTLEKIGLKVKGIWSVIMPNDYVLLPGFDVDSIAVEKDKLKKAPERIQEISEGIIEGSETVDVVRGSLAWIKTYLVYPLFKRWGVFPNKWHSTPSCVGCGICAKVCPLGNVSMTPQRKPKWGNKCCSCVACYHSCPRHSVEYGNMTGKKGQYLHPEKMNIRNDRHPV